MMTTEKSTLYTKEEQEEKIIRMILKNNKHARYAAICDANGDILCDEYCKDGENILTLEETKDSLKRSLARWKEREEFADKIGKGEYAVVSYEKIKRVTIPMEDDRIVFVSVDSGKNVEMKYVLELIDYTLHKCFPLFPPTYE